MPAASFFVGLMALTSLAAASPMLEERDAAAAAAAKNSRKFKIQVSNPNPVNKDCHSKFDGLYLVNYHTGAGQGDVTAIANATNVNTAQVNSTGVLAFDTYGPTTPAYMTMYGNDELGYANWAQPMIIIGAPAANSYNGRFYINGTDNLQWTSNNNASQAPSVGNEFMGWLICDWFHEDYPQLFWRARNVAPSKNCELVTLKTRFV